MLIIWPFFNMERSKELKCDILCFHFNHKMIMRAQFLVSPTLVQFLFFFGWRKNNWDFSSYSSQDGLFSKRNFIDTLPVVFARCLYCQQHVFVVARFELRFFF